VGLAVAQERDVSATTSSRDESGRRAFTVDGKALRLRSTLDRLDANGTEHYRIQEKVARIRDAMEFEKAGGGVAAKVRSTSDRVRGSASRSAHRTPSRTKDTVVLILVLLAVGMAIGWAAQLIMGASRATVDWTLALVAGVLGSFVGGTIGSLLSGDGLDVRPSGIIGSLVGAIIVVLVWQRVIAPRRARR
jgi:uncharacterized membrane protein YeaQ/YmgE (transglycosylase-associated protein family)